MARKHPLKLIASIALIAVTMAAGFCSVGPYASAVVAVALVAALADFLFPVTYVITRDGAACRMLLKTAEIRWENVKHCYLDDAGVKLSPLGRKSRLEAFRGVYLRFGDNREQVIEVVKALRAGRCLD